MVSSSWLRISSRQHTGHQSTSTFVVSTSWIHRRTNRTRRLGLRVRRKFSRMMRRLLSALGVTVLLLVLCPHGATAQTPQTTTHQLRLVHQTAFVGPNGTFTAEISTGDLPATTTFDLVLYSAITTRYRLDRTIGQHRKEAPFSTKAVSIPFLSKPLQPTVLDSTASSRIFCDCRRSQHQPLHSRSQRRL